MAGLLPDWILSLIKEMCCVVQSPVIINGHLGFRPLDIWLSYVFRVTI